MHEKYYLSRIVQIILVSKGIYKPTRHEKPMPEEKNEIFMIDIDF